MSNQELAQELHKPFIRKFEKRKVDSFLINIIWVAELPDMKLISKFNKEFCCLLSVIDIYSKYAQIVPLKDKKVLQLLMPFKKSQMSLILNQTKYG